MRSEIIVALDFAQEKKALALVEQLEPTMCKLKVGLEMFSAFGRDFVQQLQRLGFDLFLDLKFHDIPATVAAACKKVAELDLWMTNVHALGGFAMMQAAKQAICEVGSSTRLIAVTMLTSHQQSDLSKIGLHQSIEKQVTQLAALAIQAELDGVVCSAQEVQLLKQAQLGEQCLFVTPGIRPAWSAVDDQKRIMTPAQAQAIGAQYLVIGRPITGAKDPMHALTRIRTELEH